MHVDKALLKYKPKQAIWQEAAKWQNFHNKKLLLGPIAGFKMLL